MGQPRLNLWRGNYKTLAHLLGCAPLLAPVKNENPKEQISRDIDRQFYWGNYNEILSLKKEILNDSGLPEKTLTQYLQGDFAGTSFPKFCYDEKYISMSREEIDRAGNAEDNRKYFSIVYRNDRNIICGFSFIGSSSDSSDWAISILKNSLNHDLERREAFLVTSTKSFVSDKLKCTGNNARDGWLDLLESKSLQGLFENFIQENGECDLSFASRAKFLMGSGYCISDVAWNFFKNCDSHVFSRCFKVVPGLFTRIQNEGFLGPNKDLLSRVPFSLEESKRIEREKKRTDSDSLIAEACLELFSQPEKIKYLDVTLGLLELLDALFKEKIILTEDEKYLEYTYKSDVCSAVCDYFKSDQKDADAEKLRKAMHDANRKIYEYFDTTKRESVVRKCLMVITNFVSHITLVGIVFNVFHKCVTGNYLFFKHSSPSNRVREFSKSEAEEVLKVASPH